MKVVAIVMVVSPINSLPPPLDPFFSFSLQEDRRNAQFLEFLSYLRTVESARQRPPIAVSHHHLALGGLSWHRRALPPL